MKKINSENINLSELYINNKEIVNVKNVLLSKKLVQGKKVELLEKRFKEICGTKYAVATNNGTSALHTALVSAGIMPGDDVITSPFTFIATANSILMAGAKPVFVDIDDKTYNIDPKKIEPAISRKTKAILAVNLYGQPANYKEINRIAKKYKLVVIEDAAQSINSEYYGKKSGNLADIACFSLYATKNIMCGEGGMITTNNRKYYDYARLFRQHGQEEHKRYTYKFLGYNYRMTDLQATIALTQLDRLEKITEKRIITASLYKSHFKNISCLITPYIQPHTKHVYHQYTIRITPNSRINRNKLINYLKKNKIGCGVYYPIPLHLVPHLASLGYKKGDFPIAELISKEVISIPVHPLLSNSDIKFIINRILIFFK